MQNQTIELLELKQLKKQLKKHKSIVEQIDKEILQLKYLLT